MGTRNNRRSISLKELAVHLGLSTTTLSLVLNNSPAAKNIPQHTKDRIFAAARALNYRPNFLAYSLRAQRTHTLGVLVPELSEGYLATVLSGIEDYLVKEGYFYFLVSHRHKAELLEQYQKLLIERAVEGLIAVDTPQLKKLPLPLVTVSTRNNIKGVTNILLNHKQAAILALEHLQQLGHRQIAFIKGQDFSSDTEVRWNSIRDVASQMKIKINSSLVAQLEGYDPSPETGYIATTKILACGEPFTALFAFNDISAIGAIRALNEAKLRVPEDISVIGFDDVTAAAFHNPALTTIRQPLKEMGKLAAEYVLRRISEKAEKTVAKVVLVEPELVIRQSTAPIGTLSKSKPRGRK
ncbi:MAG: LacI family DNA-binding transcriptional regulator [Acidobacteriota bacterium]